MENNTPELEALARDSRKAGYMTALGAIIVLAAFAYSGWQLYDLDEKIAQKNIEIADKSQQVEQVDQSLAALRELESSLNEQIVVLRQQKDELLMNYRELGSEINRRSPRKMPLPIEAIIKPHASAEVLGRFEDGTPKRDYKLWLDVPNGRRGEIAEVVYFFNHPTFTRKIQKSTNSNDGYQVGYVGWGCLRRIVITLNLTNGKSKKIDFNMCEALGVE